MDFGFAKRENLAVRMSRLFKKVFFKYSSINYIWRIDELNLKVN